MITATKTNTIQRKGVQSEGKFQIKATGKAFRILSDGLYSDKIKAIMRELSCNAYDAHVDADNLDTPFEIHLPNKLEPTFKIRDYGVGLSHHDVVNVYTTYFESTKTESNDYIGCLGLGSKSPFSYVDNFSIVSYLNGKQRIYNAFLNEEETPTIALLSESDTKEPNGLEVSFPVQGNDSYRFEETANSVFTYFKLKPKFKGAKIDIAKVDYMLEGSNWGVRKSQYAGSAQAVMGNIAYKLSDFSGDLDNVDVRTLIRNVPIDIFFNIGDLEVAASRENLSYNKRTVANIEKVLSKVVEEIRVKANGKIDSCKTLWDAKVLTHEILTGEYAHLKEILKGQNVFEWKGTQLDGNSYIKIDDIKNKGITIQWFSPKTSWRRRRTSSDPTIGHEEVSAVHAKKSSKVFFADITRGSHLRCRQVILESPTIENKRNYYNSVEKSIDNVYLVHGDKKSVEAFRKEIGIDVIPPISSIEKKKNSSVYKTAEYNPKNATKLLVYETDESLHDSQNSSHWRKEKVQLDAGGVFVGINRYRVCGENADSYIQTINENLALIGESLDDVEIVGAKASIAHELYNDKNWKTLREYAIDKIKAHVKDNKLDDKINMAVQLNQAEISLGRIQKLVLDMNVDKTKPCGKFITAVKDIRKFQGDKEKLLNVYRLMNKFNIELAGKKDIIDLDSEWEKVGKAYPLMDDLDVWGIEDKKGEVEEYVNALDLIKFG